MPEILTYYVIDGQFMVINPLGQMNAQVEVILREMALRIYAKQMYRVIKAKSISFHLFKQR